MGWVFWTGEGILAGHADLGGNGLEKGLDELVWK